MSGFRLILGLASLVFVAACGGADDTRAADAAEAIDRADTTSERSSPPRSSGAGDTASDPAVTDSVRQPTDTAGPPPPASGGDPIELDPTTEQEIEEVPQDPVAMLRRTAGIYSSMSGMQADFTMLTRNPLLGTSVTSHGMLYQRRPDRIRLDFSDPQGDVIVGDGDFFWVYYPSVDPVQVTKTPAAGTAGVVDLQAQFVGDPITNFDHSVEGRESVAGREALAIALVPRTNRGYAKLKVWIDTEDSLVRRFEITDPNGVTRLLDLRDLEIGPTLADSLFRFTPPPGTRVVERG